MDTDASPDFDYARKAVGEERAEVWLAGLRAIIPRGRAVRQRLEATRQEGEPAIEITASSNTKRGHVIALTWHGLPTARTVESRIADLLTEPGIALALHHTPDPVIGAGPVGLVCDAGVMTDTATDTVPGAPEDRVAHEDSYIEGERSFA